MTCAESPEISFDFRDSNNETYLKIRPRTMQFNRTRGKFDSCQAEFAQEVADHIKPHLDDDQSFLRQPLPVVLYIDGDAIYRLLWTPDGVRFGEKSVHIEFQDPQKYLTRGVVDWSPDNVKLKEAYEYVFNNRDQDGPDIFADIKFTVPEESYDELNAHYDGSLFGLGFGPSASSEFREISSEEYSEGDNSSNNTSTIQEIEEENVHNIIEGNSALDFDKISPWECITRMNEKFGVRTWAAPDGNLWVGSRNATGVGHVAAPDDRRVWNMSDYNVPATRDPVVLSIIRGGWKDNPADTWAHNSNELVNLNRGTKDFRVEAVASIGSGSFLGQEIFEERIDAKRDNLEDIAKRKMMNKQREQQSGYIEILPEISGEVRSKVNHAKIGDAILTVPPEDDSNEDSICDTNIEREWFSIIGVQHELTGDGSWNLRLDVMKQLDGELNPENIETRLRYYDPSSKETIEDDQYTNTADIDWESYPELSNL